MKQNILILNCPKALDVRGELSRSLNGQVIYDGSGSLADIDDVLEGFLRDPLRTYVWLNCVVVPVIQYKSVQ